MNQTLSAEVAKFRAWAVGRVDSYGEWECDYQEWGPYIDAAHEVMRESADGRIDETDLANLLYTLARDNEIGQLKNSLKPFPELLRVLALRAKGHADYHTKWQIVVAVAEARLPDAESLIRPYLNDEHEYVRRRALLVFALFCPEEAEQIALRDLKGDYEFTRIAALCVLECIGSSLLRASAEKLTRDPNEYVRFQANRILEKMAKD